MDEFLRHAETLKQYGFDFLIVNDYEFFRERVRNVLRIDINVIPGTRKAGDFCPALGLLFEKELEGYDCWGHADLDVLFGRLDRFVSDEFLSGCDIFGNDPHSICGPFSLYRNEDRVNRLFAQNHHWVECFESSELWGFDEIPFSKTVRSSGLRFSSAFWQSHDTQPGHAIPQLKLLPDGTLMDLVTNRETMMFHFHKYRKWPL